MTSEVSYKGNIISNWFFWSSELPHKVKSIMLWGSLGHIDKLHVVILTDRDGASQLQCPLIDVAVILSPGGSWAQPWCHPLCPLSGPLSWVSRNGGWNHLNCPLSEVPTESSSTKKNCFSKPLRFGAIYYIATENVFSYHLCVNVLDSSSRVQIFRGLAPRTRGPSLKFLF